MPYRSFYSQSGVLITAVTYQLPVIVSDTGSMGDFVRENDIGLVFKQKLRDYFNWQKITEKRMSYFLMVILRQYQKSKKIKTDDTLKILNKMFRKRNKIYKELKFY